MVHLVFFKDGQPILKRPLDHQQMTIGRDASCDIQLTHPEISRQHCLLEKQNGSFAITDLSRNGTYVNEKRIRNQTLLELNDAVQVGPWSLLFSVEENPPQEETIVKDKSRQKKEEQLGQMIGTSSSMKEVFDLIRKASQSDVTVCLIGESGTGKELAARSVHDLSSRRDRPFVAVNCGAIPENLIESLLFGHEKGSFTGASDRHEGVFEEANHGTLFLDEIGEMPFDLQTRLLRVLETQTIRRVGGRVDTKVNVRLVAATNRDLKQLTVKELFRQDLFYRLYIFPIHLSPLRERQEDIACLTKHFLKMLNATTNPISFSEEAMCKLKAHEWKGNVRELKNVIQRALLMINEATVIDAENIELTNLTETSPQVGELKLGEQEKMSIIEALRKMRGNHSKAARHLGVARTTLASKMKRYQIAPRSWK